MIQKNEMYLEYYCDLNLFCYTKLLLLFIGLPFLIWQVFKTSQCTNTLPE